METGREPSAVTVLISSGMCTGAARATVPRKSSSGAYRLAIKPTNNAA